MEEHNNHLHLILQYYRCATAERQAEIDSCLCNNLLNPYLAAIHLLTEELFDLTSFPNNEKIIQSVIGERLTFERAFQYANETDREGQRVWILSNADIYFDDSLKSLGGVNLDNVIYALSRHEVQRDGTIKFIDEKYAHGSQDVWIFNTPLNLAEMYTDFRLGVPGCDNRIAYEFLNTGHIVVNPGKVIKCYHLDLTRETHLEKRTHGYELLNRADNIQEGKVAPPPYQFYIYPTDMIGLEHIDAYKQMQKKLLELTDRTDEVHALYQQITDVHIQLSELKSKIAERDQQIVERDQQIVSLVNSISWKITLPFRVALDFITKKH